MSAPTLYPSVAAARSAAARSLSGGAAAAPQLSTVGATQPAIRQDTVQAARDRLMVMFEDLSRG